MTRPLDDLAARDKGLIYVVRFSPYSGYSPVVYHDDGFTTYGRWYFSQQRAHCEGFNACIAECARARSTP